MARFSRLGNVIKSTKHIIDSEGGLTNVVSVTNLARGVNAKAATLNPVEVEVGEKINAFFISYFLIGQTGAPVGGSQNWYLARQHSDQANSAFPDPGETGTSNLRNQIIHEEKGLIGSGDGTAMAFKGVIVIPRGMRRMRQGDNWNLVSKNNGTDGVQFCIKCIYKSFA